jgi:hypothetical protein
LTHSDLSLNGDAKDKLNEALRIMKSSGLLIAWTTYREMLEDYLSPKYSFEKKNMAVCFNIT